MRQGKDEAVFISASGRSSILFKKAGTPGSRWNQGIEQSFGNRPARYKSPGCPKERYKSSGCPKERYRLINLF
jgi:hypothetical protein